MRKTDREDLGGLRRDWKCDVAEAAFFVACLVAFGVLLWQLLP